MSYQEREPTAEEQAKLDTQKEAFNRAMSFSVVKAPQTRVTPKDSDKPKPNKSLDDVRPLGW